LAAKVSDTIYPPLLWQSLGQFPGKVHSQQKAVQIQEQPKLGQMAIKDKKLPDAPMGVSQKFTCTGCMCCQHHLLFAWLSDARGICTQPSVGQHTVMHVCFAIV